MRLNFNLSPELVFDPRFEELSLLQNLLKGKVLVSILTIHHLVLKTDLESDYVLRSFFSGKVNRTYTTKTRKTGPIQCKRLIARESQ